MSLPGLSSFQYLNIFGKDEDWAQMQISGHIVLTDKTAQCVKGYLRKHGIEPRKKPFEMEEDMVFVKRADLPKAVALIKAVRLGDIC